MKRQWEEWRDDERHRTISLWGIGRCVGIFMYVRILQSAAKQWLTDVGFNQGRTVESMNTVVLFTGFPTDELWEPAGANRRTANKQKEVILHTAWIKAAVLQVHWTSRIGLGSLQNKCPQSFIKHTETIPDPKNSSTVIDWMPEDV